MNVNFKERTTINNAVQDYPATMFDGWKTKNPSTEVCMLERHRGEGRGAGFMGQLWLDSCDLGFSITNPKTGARTFWYLDTVDECMGEIGGWRFKPTYATSRRYPQVKHMTILVVND